MRRLTLQGSFRHSTRQDSTLVPVHTEDWPIPYLGCQGESSSIVWSYPPNWPSCCSGYLTRSGPHTASALSSPRRTCILRQDDQRRRRIIVPSEQQKRLVKQEHLSLLHVGPESCVQPKKAYSSVTLFGVDMLRIGHRFSSLGRV
jgi:hypothetical protein